ncbi:MAG: hypothetical protein IMY76_09525 [Chloroflexi bacterium]|nr:hypothetical protein [Chloroflexota bacterium]
MKKILLTLILTFLAAVLAVSPALAQDGAIYIKGEIVSVGDGTLIVDSYKGETFVVTVPTSFDIASIQAGDLVLIKGTVGQSGLNLIEATLLIRTVLGDNDELSEGSKDNSAYCGVDKQPHPMAAAIAERYEVPEGDIKEYFCNGFSIGAIMLALQTSEIDGVDINWSNLLDILAEGYSWGQIWEQMGLIDDVLEGYSPDGLLTAPDKIPPGLLKKPGNIPPGLLDKPNPGGKKEKDK